MNYSNAINKPKEEEEEKKINCFKIYTKIGTMETTFLSCQGMEQCTECLMPKKKSPL